LELKDSGRTTYAGHAQSSAAKNGGDPEQIKSLLGHSSISSIQTTEQDLALAVNDNLGPI
jgi:hypothetical protein